MKIPFPNGRGAKKGGKMETNKVGVLGAGTMGGGITQVVAQAGLQVALLDMSEALVKGGVEKIGKNLSRSGSFLPRRKKGSFRGSNQPSILKN
jgi:3-hydroxyacyl-CoA dehydrogenase